MRSVSRTERLVIQHILYSENKCGKNHQPRKNTILISRQILRTSGSREIRPQASPESSDCDESTWTHVMAPSPHLKYVEYVYELGMDYKDLMKRLLKVRHSRRIITLR
ncbi:hypothetical protein F2P81_025881 [Scophthalmus maximus]|uniref:Uncharacterized protein n=1 Tax=Scophthalmus maximus TaxID=52904 RepID=A0A6A4RHA6_SCOMX|nr:hypothetical protein F2P81_025881 [Scophthalmus maximus]